MNYFILIPRNQSSQSASGTSDNANGYMHLTKKQMRKNKKQIKKAALGNIQYT